MTLRERPINRQLQAYEEGLGNKTTRRRMHCWNVEERLAVGISLFHALVRLDLIRRRWLAQGAEEFWPEGDEAMRECFRRWLRSSGKAMAGLRSLEDRFGTVEGAAEFRRCCEEAQEIVAEWRPATPKRVPEPAQGALVADTDTSRHHGRPLRTLDLLSRPTEKESVPLGFNPDDYLLS